VCDAEEHQVKSNIRGLAILGLLAVTIAAVGCGGGGDEAAAAPGEPNPGTHPGQPAVERPKELPRSLRVDPAELDLGRMATDTTKSMSFRLINDGPQPITIQDCIASCGCTSTNCPKGRELQPGESADVTVTVTGGSRARRLEKTVTIRVVGEQSVIAPVLADVIAYVVVEPQIANPQENPDGKLTIRSTDGQPFRITGMNPPLLEGLPTESSTVHEVFIDWDKWRAQGGSRRIYFDIDHPEAKRTSVLVRPSVPRRRDSEGQAIGLDPAAATAIKEDNVDKLKTRLATNLDKAQLNELLIMAARHGRPGMIALIVDAGADVNSTDVRGRTPLMASVQSGDPETLRALIDKGADVNARDKVNSTALLRAAGVFGQIGVVRVLLEEGADVNAQDNYGMTPLMWAARWGDADRVKALLEAGADVNTVDKTGRTALDWAHTRGDKAQETVELLEPLTD
jgi:hypothetical protein